MLHKRRNKVVSKLRKIVYRNNLNGLRAKRLIRNFCEKVDLVYFGAVDQYQDDHKMIKGLSASTHHHDDDYAVGTINEYDIRFVNRIDSHEDVNSRLHTHTWLIYEVQLKNNLDIPHIFIGADHDNNSAYARLFSANPALQSIPTSNIAHYGVEFNSRYSIYTKSTNFITAQEVITNEIANTLAAHFWPFSLEIVDGYVYIYADNKKVTSSLLESMLRDILWLVEKLDKN